MTCGQKVLRCLAALNQVLLPDFCQELRRPCLSLALALRSLRVRPPTQLSEQQACADMSLLQAFEKGSVLAWRCSRRTGSR